MDDEFDNGYEADYEYDGELDSEGAFDYYDDYACDHEHEWDYGYCSQLDNDRRQHGGNRIVPLPYRQKQSPRRVYNKPQRQQQNNADYDTFTHVCLMCVVVAFMILIFWLFG